jgi:hypothetical protein
MRLGGEKMLRKENQAMVRVLIVVDQKEIQRGLAMENAWSDRLGGDLAV